MVRSYLNYELVDTSGLLCSSASRSLHIQTEGAKSEHLKHCVLVGALESVHLFDYRLNKVIKYFSLPLKPSESLKNAYNVTCIALSNDRRTLSVGYTTGNVALFSFLTGEHLCTLTSHTSAVTSLVFTPDDFALFSAACDTNIAVWDVAGQTGLFRLQGHTNVVSTLAIYWSGTYSFDNMLLLSGSKDGTVRVWHPAGRECYQTVPGFKAGVGCISVCYGSADMGGDLILIGSLSQTVGVFSINMTDPKKITASEAKKRTAEEAESNADAGSLNLHQVLQRRIRVEDTVELLVYEGELQRKHALTAPVQQLLCDRASGRVYCVCKSQIIDIYDRADASKTKSRKKRYEKRERKFTLSAVFKYVGSARSKHRIRSIDLVPGGEELFVANNNNTMMLFSTEIADNNLLAPTALLGETYHQGVVHASAMSNDGQYMATGGDKLLVWNTNRLLCVAAVETAPICGLVWAPGNKFVVCACRDGSIQIVDVSRAEVVGSIQQIEGGSPVYSIVLHPDNGGCIAAGADGKVAFYDFTLEDKTLGLVLTRTLQLDTEILALCMSSNSKFLAVGLLDNTVRIFHEADLKFYLSLYGHSLPISSIAISTDNTIIVTGSADKNIRIWGLDFGDCHASLYAHDDIVTSVKFIPDTHLLLSSGKDGVVRFWDCDVFKCIIALCSLTNSVFDVSVSPKGTFFAAVGAELGIRWFDKTDQQVFMSDQRNEELEMQLEDELLDKARRKEALVEAGFGNEEMARPTTADVTHTERLITAIDVASLEVALRKKFVDDWTAASEEDRVSMVAPQPDIKLMNMEPVEHVLHQLKKVPNAQLHTTVTLIPWQHLILLLDFIDAALFTNAGSIEMVGQILSAIVRIHGARLRSAESTHTQLQRIARSLMKHISNAERMSGIVLTACGMLSTCFEEKTAYFGAAENDDAYMKVLEKARVLQGAKKQRTH
ncbi:hypothetical protein PCE1_003319 [Barthelona sp. PCE]